ncbi:MAG: M48 family metalloprotease [Flavobacteriaceae bacterium]
MIIISVPRLITIAIGIGLASLGFLVLLFLLKFIFKSNKVDRSHLIEISENEEPELFKLIKEIVDKVGTTFPKKVYLSADVNASVFYDSSFWSMFLPVKKNLQIGIGLINTIDRNELKAILSHEFGHFSQKTMKVGSYVYNVNQIIYNMLYDNDNYEKMTQSWANASGYFAIFVILAIKIVEGIQWVLRKMYDFVNKNYLGLSREMEFHADEIAANITGYEPLKSSLLRMNLADYSFNTALSFYNDKITENVKSKNIFKEQSFLLQFYAEEDKLPFKNGLPIVTLEDVNKFNKSKLVIKDQWASHPSTEERIKNLEKIKKIITSDNNEPANSIFTNIEELQEVLTNNLFKDVAFEQSPVINSFDNFKLEFIELFNKNTFSKHFNGYFDDKNPIFFNINDLDKIKDDLSLSDLFNDEKVNLNYESLSLKNDIDVIKQINDKTIKIKTYDYDGRKYDKKSSDELITNLEKKLANINEQIKKNDISIFLFFKSLEDKYCSENKLKYLYSTLFNYDKEYDSKIITYNELMEKLQFISVKTPFDKIRENFKEVKKIEPVLKENISIFLKDSKYDQEIKKEMKEDFESYLKIERQYFIGENYIDKNLNLLFNVLNSYVFLLSKGYFIHKKELLDYKINLLEKAKLI